MGFQEPAPRRILRGQGLAPAWWVALAVVTLVFWAWLDRRPAQTPVPVKGPQPSSAGTTAIDPAQAEQIVHLREMLRRAERQLLDQREEIENLKEELKRAQADSELHRRGLERAVEELNRINADLDELDRLSQAISRPSFPPAPRDEVRPLGAPFVTTTLGGYVVASGMVHNPTNRSVRGTLEVSLVGSGGVIDTRGFIMDVGAGETERYDVTFTNIFPTERLGAQARWVP